MKAKLIFSIAITLLLVLPASITIAHCDTMEGPVVKAAKDALKTADINYVLMWVKKDDEATIKKLFDQVLVVRKLGKEAETLADMYFFESLVRIHRAGEGAPYTGLKTSEVEEPIATADKAIESGSADNLIKILKDAIDKGVAEKLKTVISKKTYDITKPEEGREYVEAYVIFMHYVEGIYNAAEKVADEHNADKETAETHENTVEKANEATSEEISCNKESHVFHLLLILTSLNLAGLIWLLIRSFRKK